MGKDVASMMMAMQGKTPSAGAKATQTRKPPPPAPSKKEEQIKAEADADLIKNVAAEPQQHAEDVDAQVNGKPSGDLEPVEKPPLPAVKEDGARATRRRTADMPPPPAKSGDLVQARVQPGEIGAWANEIMDHVEFAFNTTKGTALGAMLFLAYTRWDEYVEFVETWLGVPEDAMRVLVWNMVKQQQADRLAAQTVLESDR